ncbi:hypothetical protein E2986_01977 [Frieseomelitta varia]|uniref:WKF domain-containing protein n=1 Tax=Frieseomelitta varia TaxID=561572 RepID=A0A833VWA4_9HYME|nr:probable ATP-dependent RNA helicase ddx31 isoform X2 [Frieseomelitta varia]KAF3422714.1 hypothetical protein E2986_01977 [Frieseomelitta varia]
MEFDSTSKFGVRSSKSHKRTKKGYESKEITSKIDKTITSESDTNQMEKVNKQELKYTRQKRKRKISNNNNNNNNTNKRTINDNDEENVFAEIKENQDKKDEKKTNICTRTNLNDTEKIHKNDEKKVRTKQPSKRQLKREKAEKKENEKRMSNRMETMKKGLNYVSKWKHARSEWKFEKLRQIWLIDNLLDETSIPDDIFPTVLEYFEGCKGMAREQLLKKGMDIIRKVEENEENKDEVESIAYQRARELLQALPTET